jgi:hypothetical protein
MLVWPKHCFVFEPLLQHEKKRWCKPNARPAVLLIVAVIKRTSCIFSIDVIVVVRVRQISSD